MILTLVGFGPREISMNQRVDDHAIENNGRQQQTAEVEDGGKPITADDNPIQIGIRCWVIQIVSRGLANGVVRNTPASGQSALGKFIKCLKIDGSRERYV